QHAALSVAEGDHGCEEEAPGDARGRGRRRRRRGAHDGPCARPAARARRGAADRGRRLCRGHDRRVPRRAEAAVKTLVFLEHHDGAIQKGSLGVWAKAAALGGEVWGVLAGSGVRALAEEAGGHGAATVWVAEDERLAPPLPQPRVDVLAKLVRDEGFDTVLFAQSVLA